MFLIGFVPIREIRGSSLCDLCVSAVNLILGTRIAFEANEMIAPRVAG
jgi:hypothetical protein